MRVALIEKYLESIGMKLGKGDMAHTRCMIPFLLMDIVLDIYSKDIATLNLKFKIKQIRNMIGIKYREYNSEVFCRFTDEEKDELIDDMDKMCRYVADDITRLKSVFMKSCDDLPFEQKKALAGAMACGVVCTYAQTVYRDTFLHKSRFHRQLQETNNERIDAVANACYRFMEEYKPKERSLNFNGEEADLLTNIITRKIISFITNEANTLES